MAKSKTKKALLWILAGLLLVVVLLALLPGTCPPKKLTHRLVCRTNMKGLGTALMVYAFDYDDKLPIENWCDLLVMEVDVSPKSFVCPKSDCVEGESSYALNLAAAEIGTTAPASMVLMFETSAGRKGERKTLDTKRKFQTFLEDMKLGKVYKDRWNQIGGPELLTLEHHDGKGANFLFVDGRAEFVHANRLHELQWDKDDTLRLTEADVQRLVKEAKEATK